MLVRELKTNLKGLILWLVVSFALFSIVFIVYPTIAVTNTQTINQLLELFPPEILKMFNMDIASISTVFGWFMSEGYTFIVLIAGIYAANLGATILAKEESDKTIEFLLARPINRQQIINAKVVAGLINITLLVLAIGLFNGAGMYLSDELDARYAVMAVLPLMSSYALFFVSLLATTSINRPKRTSTIGIAFGLLFYFVQLLSLMSHELDWLKYLTVYTLSEVRTYIQTGQFEWVYIVVTIALSVVCYIGTSYLYHNKELI